VGGGEVKDSVGRGNVLDIPVLEVRWGVSTLLILVFCGVLKAVRPEDVVF